MVNIHEAKTHFSKLVTQAEQGREVVITRAGKPVAKLVAFHPQTRRRAPGGWVGEVVIAPDFDELDEATLRSFEE